MRRRRRKRATRLATATGTSLAGVLLLTAGPVNLGLTGGGPEQAAAVAVSIESVVPAEPVLPKPVPKSVLPKPVLPKPVPKAAVEAVDDVDPGPALTKKGLLKIPTAASGRYLVAAGRAEAGGEGEVVRYLVEMEDGLPYDVDVFAADVHRILNAPGGWGKGGVKLRFVRVEEGAVRFRVALSSPDLTDRQCAPLLTYGKVSCFNGVRSVINARRWAHGSSTYGDDLAGYRNYVISHEVGHAMGKGHVGCPEPGAVAPVMVQQTKSLEGCAANPWPFPARAQLAAG